MPKSIVVFGFGPGVSTAVAEKFGGEGFGVALVGRTEARLAAGVEALRAKKISAAAVRADAADPEQVRGAVVRARAEVGPIGAIHWNAYGGDDAGDLIAASPVAVGAAFDVAVLGLIAAVQAALPDLKAAGDGAVLVTNGAFGELTPQIDQLAVNLKAMGLATANAAKHKLVGLLAARLKSEGVYVGEVMIAGAVRGTGFDTGGPTIDPARIANQFWDLYRARDDIYARVS